MKNLTLLLIILTFMSNLILAQSEVVPSKIMWKANGISVSLKTGHEKGISKTDKLTLELYFSNDLIKKYTKEKMKFEFKWFHYYSRKKVFMDSYTIKYDDNTAPKDNSFKISSSRGNITHGWWEVVVIAKYDNKVVKFQEHTKYQIWVN